MHLWDKVKEAIADAVKDKADKTEIPTKTSQLTNNSYYQPSTAMPVKRNPNITTMCIYPNIFYCWGTVETLSIGLGDNRYASDISELFPRSTTDRVWHYCFQFTSGSTPTNLTLPSTVTFPNGIEIKANTTYQISILENIGLICEVPTT